VVPIASPDAADGWGIADVALSLGWQLLVGEHQRVSQLFVGGQERVHQLLAWELKVRKTQEGGG